MIRLTLLALFISFLCVYAWKDWFKSLCGLILLMAVVEHPDMPKGLLGIPGMNPWNLLLGVVVMAWATQRGREGLRWDMPRGTTFLFVCFIVCIFVGFFRFVNSYDDLAYWVRIRYGDENLALALPSKGEMINEWLINSLKWLVPAMLLFDGARDRKRLNWATAAVIGLYFLLAIQVIKWMPLSTLTSGEALRERSLKILLNEVGYHRVNLAVMLAGGTWAAFAARLLANSKRAEYGVLMISAITFFGVNLTGGRTGFFTCALVGMCLSLIRWRKYLVIGPIVAAVVVLSIPAVKERLTQGFTAESRDTNDLISDKVDIGSDAPDAYTITAGRNVAWPYVLRQISEGPWFGFGREGMQTTGVSAKIWLDVKEEFPHPHNAYLQWVLDNGLIGAAPLLLLLVILVGRSISLFADSTSPIFIAIGGMSLALLLSLLFGAFGSQTFYPRKAPLACGARLH